MQEAPAVRTKDFHIEADHIAVDRTEPDHTGAAATELDEPTWYSNQDDVLCHRTRRQSNGHVHA